MPANSKIAGDAKEAMDLCVAEFTMDLMRAAWQQCRQDQRLTITGDDLILAMRSLGFDNYVGPLTRAPPPLPRPAQRDATTINCPASDGKSD